MSYEAGSVALIKAYGFKAICAAIAVAMLYMALPPKNQDGTFNRHEFVLRLAFAIIVSTLCGDWFVSVVDGLAPWLHPDKFPGVFYAAIGSPAWWFSRAIAVWMQKRDGKDIGEVVKDVKEII